MKYLILNLFTLILYHHHLYKHHRPMVLLMVSPEINPYVEIKTICHHTALFNCLYRHIVRYTYRHIVIHLVCSDPQNI